MASRATRPVPLSLRLAFVLEALLQRLNPSNKSRESCREYRRWPKALPPITVRATRGQAQHLAAWPRLQERAQPQGNLAPTLLAGLRLESPKPSAFQQTAPDSSLGPKWRGRALASARIDRATLGPSLAGGVANTEAGAT